MYLSIPFELEAARRCKICFSSEAETSVWLDDAFAFGRDAGGRMMPSPHLAPLNTHGTFDLAAGRHELIAVLKKPAPGLGTRGGQVTFNLDLADADSLQWLTDVLIRPKTS